MSDESPNPEKSKRSKVVLTAVLASGIASAATYVVQKQSTEQQIANLEGQVANQQEAAEKAVRLEKEAAQKALKEKEAQLEQERIEIQEQLSMTTEQHQEKFQNTTTELSSNLKEKVNTIGTLNSDIATLKDSLITSLDITQDVYAMKWQTNNSVLSDMENHSARTLDVTEKWEELITKLSPQEELAPQLARLRIRLAQAYSGLGLVDKIELSKINWKAAGLEEQKPEIEARLWFSLATNSSKSGKLKEAKEYLDKAKAIIPEMTTTPDKATYYSAMMNLLEAEITASKSPAASLKFYNKAADDLAEIVTTIPSNTKLRTTFIQVCLDGALLSEGGTSAGQAESLRKRAFKGISQLLKDHPKLKKPHLLYAEVKLFEVEDLLREGEQFKASELLTTIRSHIKKGGGDVLLTAEADSSKAFIHWDHGEREKAMEIMDTAIYNVDKYLKENPKSPEAHFRLASLFWVRSSMQITPAGSIGDGQQSVHYLVELVKNGAGKREASARRIIAIIYGDIGHQAATSNQKSTAKQYFLESKKQWEYLAKNWGESDEYTEGIRWSEWEIENL